MNAPNTTNFDLVTLIRNHTHQLIAFAKSFTKNLSDAEDLYQDTVFLVLKNKDKFSEGTNFLPWVKTIMRNTFINHYRKNKRHQLAMTTAGSGFFFKQQHTGNPTESQIAVQDIYQLIDGVPKIYRIPFLMCYVGYSYEEIAQQIKVPAGTVKSRIYYARQHLRNAYREMEVE